MQSFALVLLHGLGADASDMNALAEVLVEDIDQDIKISCPNAPLRSITINQNMLMPAWYDIYELDSIDREDTEGISDSYNEITALIDEISTTIPANRIILGGFSQGAAIAIYTALRYKARLAGILLLSGYCPRLNTISEEQTQQALNILQIHGVNDDTLPIELAMQTYDELCHQGHSVELLQHNYGHEIEQNGLIAAQKWIANRFLLS